MGRRTKLTPEVRDRFAKALTQGLPYSLAARYAGIGERTVYEWLAKARADDADPWYCGFAEAVESAEATAALISLGQVQTAARGGNWRAAAWILERRFPEFFARPAKRENPAAQQTPAPAPGSSAPHLLPQQQYSLLKATLALLLEEHPELAQPDDPRGPQFPGSLRKRIVAAQSTTAESHDRPSESDGVPAELDSTPVPSL